MDVSLNPWVEKYRPTSLQDICGQGDIVQLFHKSLDNNQVMHFLFFGPPGTGKTSAILSFCHDIYDEDQWSKHVLEINASYDRGIDMVRSKIKTFCKKSMTPFMRDGRRVHYKFVILDEADTLTIDAQNSLRRCIEIYSYNTRFCFLCNYPSRIITPILSRCFACHFQPIPRANALEQMRYICDQEGLDYEHDALCKVYERSRGDLRACVSSLQALSYMYGQIDIASFADYAGNFPDTIWDSLRNATLDEVVLTANYIYRHAHSIRAVISSFIDWLLASFDDEPVYSFCITLSQLEKQTVDCSDTRLFILYLLQMAWSFVQKEHPRSQ